MFTLSSVTKKFGNHVAVDNVSLTVEAGEIFTLIGPNGSGKTTIIKMIAGLLRPDEGVISIENFDVVKQPIEAKSHIGYIPDEPMVWGQMTGEEFLHFSGALYSMPEQARVEKIKQWLATFHLEGLEQGRFASYSRGNRQKFSIIAAMMHAPKLLLVDEPIVGLDPESTEIAKTVFTQFAQDGGTVFLVTHTLSFAESIATRVGLLHHGKLQASGSLVELRTEAGLDRQVTLENIYQVYSKK